MISIMKTSLQIFITVFTTLCVISAATGQENTQLLTFGEALQMVNERNPALLQAKQQIKQKEFELKSKRGLYMPQVSLSANAVTMSDPLHLDLTPVKDAITPLYNTLGNYGVFSGVPNPNPNTNQIAPILPDNISTWVVREKLLAGEQEIANANWDEIIQEKNFALVSANVMWPLFAGGKIKGANNAAEIDVAISREEFRQTEGNLLYELVTRYYGLSLGTQVLKVRQQMVETAKHHHSDAQKLYDNGMIAKVELLHAQVSRNEAERELKQAERNIEIIRSGLEATLALDSAVTIIPASLLFINKELSEVSHWIAQANSDNPQLKQIEGKSNLIDIKNKVDKGNYLPSLAMIGTYNIADKNFSPFMPDWMVGVGMKWTVFNGLGRSNEVKAGETMHNQVEFATQKAQADLRAYLTKLYEELQMQMEQKTELETTLELAEHYATSTEKSFNEGLANSTTVVEAFTKVAQVKAMRLKVLYDYDVLLAQLLQTAGVPEQYINFCSGENTIIETLEL
jgi:outer membrane protein TolC